MIWKPKSIMSNKNISEVEVSIIVPCYNEDLVIAHTHKRLKNELEKLGNKYEIVYVNDGSFDKTRKILKEISGKDADNVKIINFSRNFGHQIAVTAGIDHAIGNAVILIDADLQDPPELIHDMVRIWKEGYDIVYGQRKQRKGESKFKLLTAKLFYRLLAYLSDVNIPVDTGDFRLLDRKVVEVLKKMPERDRFIRGMVAWVGFKQFALQYDRDERLLGESKYPFWKMVAFATDGILSFSVKPLRIATIIGFISSIVAFLGIFYAFIMRFIGDPIEGWTLMFIAIMFLGGVQLISLGIIGEYIGRTYGESKKRPLYVMDDFHDNE
jgi:polyisoprenyl-phosphate glycosyltransferase